MTLWEIVIGISGMLLLFAFCAVAFGIVSDLWYGISGAGHRETVKELRTLREESRAAREVPTGRRGTEEKDALGLDPILSPDRCHNSPVSFPSPSCERTHCLQPFVQFLRVELQQLVEAPAGVRRQNQHRPPGVDASQDKKSRYASCRAL